MTRKKPIQEELDLDRLHDTELQLRQREKELAESRQRIAQERIERERTMPPLEEIRERIARKQHEELIASRGEVANVLRVQNRSLLLLVLLLAATATLIWWGVKLMQGA
jgi:hypothetical protein